VINEFYEAMANSMRHASIPSLPGSHQAADLLMKRARGEIPDHEWQTAHAYAVLAQVRRERRWQSQIKNSRQIIGLNPESGEHV
jgi:hypothetical protein